MTLKLQMDAEESHRIHEMLANERVHWQAGRSVAGLDEAGRGPLAGPVVAAAVVFLPNPEIPRINDSKKLDEDSRSYLYDLIRTEALDYGVGSADVAEIDELNILQATFLAMRRALSRLRAKPHHLLVDGRTYLDKSIPFTTIVKGDSKSYSIAAASILAKVTRDRIMQEYDREFPGYGFARHKGYGTGTHLDAIEELGFCPIHRRSFHPKRFQDQQLCLF